MRETIKSLIPLILTIPIGIFLRINRDLRITEFGGYRIFIEHFINYLVFILLFIGAMFIVVKVSKEKNREKALFGISMFLIIFLFGLVSYIWENIGGRWNTPEQTIPNILGIIVGTILSWIFYYKEIYGRKNETQNC